MQTIPRTIPRMTVTQSGQVGFYVGIPTQRPGWYQAAAPAVTLWDLQTCALRTGVFRRASPKLPCVCESATRDGHLEPLQILNGRLNRIDLPFRHRLSLCGHGWSSGTPLRRTAGLPVPFTLCRFAIYSGRDSARRVFFGRAMRLLRSWHQIGAASPQCRSSNAHRFAT